jgi:hypothetical protein
VVSCYGDCISRRRGLAGPLVFDEFPYWAGASAELASQFQRWIDGEARQARLCVAIAGSSQRMMQGLVLDASAPLYGRAVELMEIGPLGAGFLGEGLKITDPVSCVRSYAVWGGVPRYWELAEPYGTDLDRAVDHCILDPLGPLHREPDRLLLEELPPAAACRPILDVIGMGAHRLSEIAARLRPPLDTSPPRVSPVGRAAASGESENLKRSSIKSPILCFAAGSRRGLTCSFFPGRASWSLARGQTIPLCRSLGGTLSSSGRPHA